MKARAVHKRLTTHHEMLGRLARIEGQIRGIQRMIREEAYCMDILTQVQAAQSALRSVSRRILVRHLESCVFKASQEGGRNELRDKLDEIATLLKRNS